MRRLHLLASLAALAIFSAGASERASAQADVGTGYTSKPIRFVVGYAAGGGNDIFARLVGDKVREFSGPAGSDREQAGRRRQARRRIRYGSAGRRLYRARGCRRDDGAGAGDLPQDRLSPDPHLHAAVDDCIVPADPCRSRRPPGKVSLAELIAWAKAHPDKANYATSSPAFTITTELLKLKTGMPGVPIPYKSTNEMIVSVASEQTLFAIGDGPPTVPLVQSGKIRALAVTGAERSLELPDVPTMAELGLPQVSVRLWSGLFISGMTPPTIKARLESAVRRALADAGVRQAQGDGD
jgi:tripartite-type tricarboxylate transporter receptor subunit TctC